MTLLDFFQIQVMINIITTFGLSVMAFYTFYQYRFQQNEFYKTYLFIMFEIFILYLISTLAIFYMAHSVAKEVSTKNRCLENEKKNVSPISDELRFVLRI